MVRRFKDPLDLEDDVLQNFEIDRETGEAANYEPKILVHFIFHFLTHIFRSAAMKNNRSVVKNKSNFAFLSPF